jgi:hypothetical protein
MGSTQRGLFHANLKPGLDTLGRKPSSCSTSSSRERSPAVTIHTAQSLSLTPLDARSCLYLPWRENSPSVAEGSWMILLIARCRVNTKGPDMSSTCISLVRISGSWEYVPSLRQLRTCWWTGLWLGFLRRKDSPRQPILLMHAHLPQKFAIPRVQTAHSRESLRAWELA